MRSGRLLAKFAGRASQADLQRLFRNRAFPAVLAIAALTLLAVLAARGLLWLAIPMALAGGLLALYGLIAEPWTSDVRPGEPWFQPWSRSESAGAGLGSGLGVGGIVLGKLIGYLIGFSFGLLGLLAIVLVAVAIGLSLRILQIGSRLLRQFGLLYVVGTAYLIAAVVAIAASNVDFRSATDRTAAGEKSIAGRNGSTDSDRKLSDDRIECSSTVDLDTSTDRDKFSEMVEPGVKAERVILNTRRGTPGFVGNKLCIYTPLGRHKYHSLGCIFIAPAGARMYAGMTISPGDEKEHLPYVRAGYAVTALEIDGEETPGAVNRVGMESAYKQFSAAEGGLVNGKNAIEYVLAKVPEVDPQRLYVAGHSSAATFALLFAEHEPRVKGCIAYAPLADLFARPPGHRRNWNNSCRASPATRRWSTRRT